MTRRHIDAHLVDMDGSDVPRNVQNPPPPQMKSELLYVDKWWEVGTIIVMDRKTLPGCAHLREGGNVHCFQINLACKTFFEFAHHPVACPVIDISRAPANKNTGDGQQHNDRSGNQKQLARRASNRRHKRIDARNNRERCYWVRKISGWVRFSSEAVAATLTAASKFRVTGGRQSSVLQAW